MAKKPKTRDGIQRSPWLERNGLRHEEIVTLACKYFCKGHPATEIVTLLKQKHGVKLTREEPYRLILYAASRGWLRFNAPIEHELCDLIQEKYSWLEKVKVVQTATSDHVAHHAAAMLLELARSYRRGHPFRREFHVGFAGGNLLRKTARSFAEMLRQPIDLPKKIVFHAMVAGFNVEDPITDPNAFFTYFGAEPPMQVDASFVGLLGPGIVRGREMDNLRAVEAIRRAFERVKEIDVIVTSAGHWQNGHSVLYSMYRQEAPHSLEQLLAAGCIGDMLWRPVGRDGPIEIETEIRTMTLMELSQLPGFIAEGKHVVLITGPCGNCRGPKTDVLETILNLRKHLVTHLVVDSRSANGLFTSDLAA